LDGTGFGPELSMTTHSLFEHVAPWTPEKSLHGVDCEQLLWPMIPPLLLPLPPHVRQEPLLLPDEPLEPLGPVPGVSFPLFAQAAATATARPRSSKPG
jgi:hypothetical protein